MFDDDVSARKRHRMSSFSLEKAIFGKKMELKNFELPQIFIGCWEGPCLKEELEERCWMRCGLFLERNRRRLNGAYGQVELMFEGLGHGIFFPLLHRRRIAIFLLKFGTGFELGLLVGPCRGWAEFTMNLTGPRPK